MNEPKDSRILARDSSHMQSRVDLCRKQATVAPIVALVDNQRKSAIKGVTTHVSPLTLAGNVAADASSLSSAFGENVYFTHSGYHSSISLFVIFI